MSILIKKFFQNIFYYKINEEHGTGLGPVVPNDLGMIVGKSTKSYISNSFFPIKVEDDYRRVLSEQLQNTKYTQKDFAIIMAGPLKIKNNFTLNALKHYRKYFPETNILLSTWDNEHLDYLNECRNYCNQVFLNKLPTTTGWGNLNLQISSMFKPLTYAIEKNILFSIKTRTDCLAYDTRLLVNLLNKREIIKKVSPDKNEKIFVTDLGTFKFRPYGPTDIFQFGKTKTLFDYWNLDSEEKILNNLQQKYKFSNKIKNQIPTVAEILLCLSYLEFNMCKLKFDLKDWYKYLVKYFAIINSSDIQLFWFKYDWRTMGHKSQSFHTRGPVFLDETDYMNLLLRGDKNLLSFGIIEKWRIATDNVNYPTKDGLEQISY